MEFLAEDLIEMTQRFMLPLIRLSSFFMAAPIYGAQSVPVRVRVFLALVVTILLFPSIGEQATFDPLSGLGVLLVTQEVLIGIAMGLILQFVMAAITMGGHSIATAIGLGFASSADPQNGHNVTLIGQLYVTLATLIFISIDGHLFALEILASSFESIPHGQYQLDTVFVWQVVLYSSQLFITGLLLAIPVMAGVLLVNLGFGVMSRASPQMNVFSIGFPMTMMAGFLLMLLTLPVFMPQLQSAFTTTFTQLTGLLQ